MISLEELKDLRVYCKKCRDWHKFTNLWTQLPQPGSVHLYYCPYHNAILLELTNCLSYEGDKTIVHTNAPVRFYFLRELPKE